MKSTASRQSTQASVMAQLAEIKTLSVNELKEKWEALFGDKAPNNSRSFLELRISYRIQELCYGGLSKQTRRTLDLLADVQHQQQPAIKRLGSFFNGIFTSPTYTPEKTLQAVARAAKSFKERKAPSVEGVVRFVEAG